VELKIYSEIKDINSIKIGCVISGGRGDIVSNCVYSVLATLVFCDVTVNRLPGSVVVVSSWQMLRRDRSPTVMVEVKVLSTYLLVG